MSYYLSNNKKRSATDMAKSDADAKNADAKYAEILAAIAAREKQEALEAQIPGIENRFSSLQVNNKSGKSSGGQSGMRVDTGPSSAPEPYKTKQQKTGVPKDLTSLEKLVKDLQFPAFGTSTETVSAAPSYSSVAAAAAAAGDIEMEGTEPVKAPAPVLPIRQQRKPQEDRFAYRQIPHTLQAPALLQIEGAEDFGSLYRPRDTTKVYSTTAYLNFGRFALPSLAVKIHGPRSGTKTEIGDKASEEDRAANKYMYLDWQPGVKVNINDAATETYQIEDLALHDTKSQDAYEGVANQQILDASADPDKRERLVKISWTGRDGRVHLGKRVSKGNFTQFASEAIRKSINALTSTDTLKATMWFLLPQDTNLLDFAPTANPDGSPVPNMFGYFQTMYNHRTPPYAYLSKNFGQGELDVHEEMAPINIAGNRMLVNYADNQETWLQEQEADPALTDFIYPQAPGFHAYRRQLHYSSKEEFVKVIGTSHVRNHQWDEGEYARLSLGRHKIKVRKPIRITKKELNAKKEFVEMEVDKTTAKKRRMMYGYVTLNQSHEDKMTTPLPIPVDGTVFKVDFEEPGPGRERIRHSKQVQWNAYVKEMTEEEKAKVPGADFLLIMSRPYNGLKIEASDSFDHMRSQIIRLDHIVNAEPCKRVLEAVKELADPDRKDMDNILWPLMFRQESRVTAGVDLTRGPADTDENARIYDEAAKELIDNPPKFATVADEDEDGFTADQIEIFTSDWKKVPNNLKIILGGAGSQKTTTLAWSTVLLMTVDHSVQVLSEQDEASNKFCRLVYRLMKYAQNNYKFGKHLHNNKIIRFLPPSYEIHAMKSELDRVELVNGTLTIGKNDAASWKKRPEFMAMFDNFRCYMEDQMSQDNPDGIEGQQLRAKAFTTDLEKLKENHQRLDAKERVFELPLECSMGYHIERLRESDPGLSAKFEAAEEAVNNFEEGEGDFTDVQTNFTNRAHDLMGAALSQANMVVSTYISAAHPLLRENFKPTIVAHEEASQTKVATAAIGISLRDIQCHIFIGDEYQLLPHSSTKVVDEFNKTTNLSILKWFLLKGVPYRRLTVQFRMHPSIFQFPNESFYDGKVTSAKCTKKDNSKRELFRSVISRRYGRTVPTYDQTSQYFGINVKYGVSAPVPGSTSLQNYASATAVAGTVQDLIGLGAASPSDIVVLCYYAGQRSRTRKLLDDAQIETHTVDKFQGSDKPFVLLDMTSAPAPHVRFDGLMGGEATKKLSAHVVLPERLCVALTRAKDGLLVFGNFDSWNYKIAHGDSSHLEAMVHNMVKRNIVLHDDTRDTNPLLLSRITTKQADDEYRAALKKADSLGWMSTVRNRFSTRPKSALQVGLNEGESEQVAYTGQQFGKALGIVPSILRNEAGARLMRPGSDYLPSKAKEEKKKALAAKPVVREAPTPEWKRGGGRGRGSRGGSLAGSRGGNRGVGGP